MCKETGCVHSRVAPCGRGPPSRTSWWGSRELCPFWLIEASLFGAQHTLLISYCISHPILLFLLHQTGIKENRLWETH